MDSTDQDNWRADARLIGSPVMKKFQKNKAEAEATNINYDNPYGLKTVESKKFTVLDLQINGGPEQVLIQIKNKLGL